MAIKITLYRVSKDSPIIAALMRAAENGKEIMTLVELKARFDEDNNIQWAKQLEQAGIHVVYGIIGFKTHTKIALIVRKEKGRLRNYFHIGTGNYNSNTSKFYTDLGLLSTDPDIASDLLELFNYLSGFSKQKSYQKLLVSPSSMRERFIFFIKREIIDSCICIEGNCALHIKNDFDYSSIDFGNGRNCFRVTRENNNLKKEIL